MMIEQHVAVFMGEKKHLLYGVHKGGRHWSFWEDPEMYKIEKHLSYEEIVKANLDNPPLEIGDFIYINKLNNKYKVNEIARSTNNEYVYYVDYVTELVEDEATESSERKAEDLLSECLKELEIAKQEYYKSKKEVKEEVKKKWYQFWK